MGLREHLFGRTPCHVRWLFLRLLVSCCVLSMLHDHHGWDHWMRYSNNVELILRLSLPWKIRHPLLGTLHGQNHR